MSHWAANRGALLPNDAQSIRLQTGTVAGSINLSPTFVTDGGINLTPTCPTTLSLTVPAAAPRLLNVSNSTTQATLNVESTFLGWYQGSTSGQFGSLFTATLPLTITGDVKNVTNPSDTIQSIAVTIANRTGTSNSLSVNVQ